MKKNIYQSVLVLVVLFSNFSWSQNIVYPWRATTAIVKKSQTFEVWFNAASGQTVNSIQLKSPYITVNTTFTIVDGNWTYDQLSGNKYNKRITVTVPATTPADRYDIVLNTTAGAVTSYGGAKVITDFKTDYYLLHWSDGHLYQNGYDTTVLLKRKDALIDIANIMDAEIIIETGDNLYNVRNNPSREVDYFIGNTTQGTKGMAKATAATFMTPGDHDGLNGNDYAQGTVQENSDFFNDYYGLQNHFFKYGNSRYMNLNNAWGLSATNNGVHQYQVENAKAWLDANNGDFLVTSGHSYDRMHKFINDHKPLDLVLAGDKHHSGPENPWEITPSGPNIAYIVNSIRDHFQFNIYKVNDIAGTFTKPAGVTAMINVLNSGDEDVPSTWVSNLKLSFSNSNNGTQEATTATIVNKFAFTIEKAKIRFVVPKGNTYTVTNGTITQQFNGTNFYIVDVATDVNANTTKTVSLSKNITIAVTGVTLTPATASLAVGATQQLTATIAPSNATNKTINYASSNAGIATVNSSGIVTAVSAGSATITVTTQDGSKTDTATILVVVPITTVALTPATASLAEGNTQQLTATVAPSTASNKAVTYASNNTGVATVNSTGLVTAVAVGSATITVTTQDGSKTDTATITVTAALKGVQILQAEDATLSGAVEETNQTGFVGTGFVDFVNITGDYIQWTVNVTNAGTYDLSFRYSLLSGSRPLELKVNNVVKIASFDFSVTGSWSGWEYVSSSQTLNAGNNTIRLTTIGSNGGNIDELRVAPYLDACDAVTGWGTASTNTLSYSTADKKQGAGSVQMVGSATEEFKKVFSPSFYTGTTTANGVLSFWYYISDITKTGTVRVELGSGGTNDVNELSWGLNGLVNGWNQINLNFSDASVLGTPNLNALNWFRIFSTKTASITTKIDGIFITKTTGASNQRTRETLAVEKLEKQDASEKSIQVYPNPYQSGKLSITLKGLENSDSVQINITNLLGQLIHTEKVSKPTQVDLNLSQKLTESVYFIAVESGNSKIIKKLLVK